MRKCRSCGFLLLGEGATCGRCGAPLDVVTTSVPAVAGSAGGSAPLPPAWAPPPPSGEPVPLRDAWRPVTVAASPARPVRATRLGIGVLVGVLAVGLGLGVMHFRSDPLPKGTSDFASGGGVSFTSPDGAFEVLMPQTPAVQQRSEVVDDVSANLYIAVASTNDYLIGAMSIEFPSSVRPGHVNDLLNAVLTGGVSGVNGKLVRKSLLTHDTLPAIEGSFKAPDGYRADVLVIASGSRLIMLLAHATTGTDRLYKALEDSLIVR